MLWQSSWHVGMVWPTQNVTENGENGRIRKCMSWSKMYEQGKCCRVLWKLNCWTLGTLVKMACYMARESHLKPICPKIRSINTQSTSVTFLLGGGVKTPLPNKIFEYYVKWCWILMFSPQKFAQLLWLYYWVLTGNYTWRYKDLQVENTGPIFSKNDILKGH